MTGIANRYRPVVLPALLALVIACGASGSGGFGGGGVTKEDLRVMWYAVQGNDLAEVQRLLEEKPALLNAERGDPGRTPLYFSLVYNDDDLSIAEYLLEQGADPNIPANKGWTLLHNMVYESHLPYVELLLRHGADPSLTTEDGETPLDMARRYGGREHIEAVLVQAQ